MTVVRASYVLVVDDDRDIRESIEDVLRDEGYSVQCASNGREALQQLRVARPPCLILLDLMMPVMDGATFLTLVRADPDLSQIPVCIVSARREISPDLVGQDQAIAKPLELDDLLDVVGRFCCKALEPLK